MNAEKKGRKRTLGGRFLKALIIQTIIICVSVSALVGIFYYNSQIEQYGEVAYSVGRLVANRIDGDRIRGYLDTLEKDAYYWEVEDFIKKTQQEFGLLYHYVFVDDGETGTYIWSADADEALGYTEEGYSEEDKKTAREVLSDNPPEDFVLNYTSQYGFCGTAWVPVHDSAGKSVAIVGVDYSMPEILRMILLFALVVVAAVVIVTVLGGLLFYRNIKKNIIRPVELLEKASGELVNNIDQGVPFRADIHTSDELEALAESFGKMDQGLRKYIHELAQITAEKERISAELDVAAGIQTGMLPSVFPAFPNRPEFDIHASMDPAKEVGGDFYDFFLIDEDHLALVIADVSGKGIPASLFMMSSKILINEHARMGGTPAEILERVNKRTCVHNDACMFVTVWLGILEISSGKLTAASAGHEYPMVNTNGRYELLKDRHGLAIGAMERSKYKNTEIRLKKGDSIFVYTDGVAEATDANGELFGTERTVEALNKVREGASQKEILEGVRAAVDAFVRDEPQFDDLTMLGLKYFGSEDAGGTEERS